MKFAAIVPFPMLPSIADNDYHMVLAPQCLHPVYYQFYMLASGHLILDNGAAEGMLRSNEQLVKLAYEIYASEVVAPDVLHDANASIRLLGEFCEYVRTLPIGIKVMAVLQGRTWPEFTRSLGAAIHFDVASVALPKLLTMHLGANARLEAARLVRERTNIPIHCLGCGTQPREVVDLARQGIVRGIDSAAPIVLGLQGQDIRQATYNWQVSHRAVPDYWNKESTRQVEVNLATFADWCRAAPSAR